MSMIRILPLVLGAALLLGCEDEAARSATAPPPPAGNGPVVLVVSDSTPAAGAVITVSALVRPGSGIAAASYLARLGYDRAGLSFVQDLTHADGLRAINPQPGLIRAAGASTRGFADGVLFSLEFRVTDPARLGSLELRLDELNGRDFRTALPRVATDRVARFTPASR